MNQASVIAGERRHDPVVTDFEVRPATYPEGHWLNRYWLVGARVMARFIQSVPFYRFVLRAAPEAQALLAKGRPAVFACTHQDVLDCFNGLPRLVRDRNLVAMTSPSRDGGLAAIVLRALGYEVVRGSSACRGGEALIQMRNRVRGGASAVFACDGPKAPLGDVKPGVVYLARGARVPVVPMRAWGMERLRFHRSWTKLSMSVPLFPVGFFLGAPIDVGLESESVRPCQIEIARSLADLARKASVWCEEPPIAPFSVAGE